MVENGKLPKVATKKEFMDYLSNVINPPKDDEGAGRMRELKSYIIESDHGVPVGFDTKKMSFEIVNTDLEKMKILRTRDKEGRSSEMFMNTKDSRFLVLHTNELSNTVGEITEEMVSDPHHSFDHTWFHSLFLKQLTEKGGNAFEGFGVKYTSEYLDDDDAVDSEDLGLSVSGSLASHLRDLVEKDPKIKRRTAYNKVGVIRGSRASLESYVQDEVYNNGHFSVKKGKSVQDHLQLIDIAKEDYSRTMKEIENIRIGLREVKDRTLVEGKPFDFEFPDKIDNLQTFLSKFFSSKKPFKMWGIKMHIREDYFKVMAVDLHTGSPMDFEIANDMMRVYLFKGSCGNTILRLLTNLQAYFDSRIKCPQVMQCVSE